MRRSSDRGVAEATAQEVAGPEVAGPGVADLEAAENRVVAVAKVDLGEAERLAAVVAPESEALAPFRFTTATFTSSPVKSFLRSRM